MCSWSFSEVSTVLYFVGTVGFLDFALEEDSLLSTLDVTSTLGKYTTNGHFETSVRVERAIVKKCRKGCSKYSALVDGFSKAELEQFLEEYGSMRHVIECFEKIHLLVSQVRDHSLFTPELRNKQLKQLVNDHLTEGAEEDISGQVNPKAKNAFLRTLQKSQDEPEARFPPWLLFALSQETELLLRPRLGSFLLARKIAGVGNSNDSTTPPKITSARSRAASNATLPLDLISICNASTSGSPRMSTGNASPSMRGPALRRFKFGASKNSASDLSFTEDSDQNSFSRRSRRAGLGSDYNLKSYLETSGELSIESDKVRDIMQVRVTTLNTGGARTKSMETECLLDESNRCLYLYGRISAEIEVVQCAMVVEPKNSGFALTSAGFRYEFRGQEGPVSRLVSVITRIQIREETMSRERVLKRNAILALDAGSPPVSTHFRTFAPEVRPEIHDDPRAISAASSDAEEQDPDEHLSDAEMPWSLPNVHLAVSKELRVSSDSFSVTDSSTGDTVATMRKMSALSKNYGMSPAQIRRQSYGMGSVDMAAFAARGYGAPPVEGTSQSAPTMICGYGGVVMPPLSKSGSYGGTSSVVRSPLPKKLSLAQPLPSGHGYHETIPFQYHSVMAGIPSFGAGHLAYGMAGQMLQAKQEGMQAKEEVNEVEVEEEDISSKDANDESFSHDDDDEEGKVVNDDDEEEEDGNEVSMRSNLPVMSPLEQMDRVIQREERHVSKKLHRKPTMSSNIAPIPNTNQYRATAPLAALERLKIPLRDSGYCGVLGGSSGSEGSGTGFEMSPRMLADVTEGKTFSDVMSPGRASSPDPSESEQSSTEDSQWARARDKYGDFNERFQRLMDVMREVEEDHRLYDRILGMSEDFFESAKRYARIVIDEAFLDNENRTIHPVAPNVYVVGHIVLELCNGNDVRFPENLSYEMSAKAMGHQLKSFSALEDVESNVFSLPLLAIIDLRGLRCTAYCKLPISSKTLVYGPLDGHFYDKDASTLSELKRCMKKLNLKPSFCGLEKKRVRVVGGYGVQVHKATDKRYYVAQAGDMYPCVRPHDEPGRKSDKGSEFVELFRPEFVQCYPTALSPNVYKPWAAGMPDEEESKSEIDEATRLLETVLIPTFAKDLTELVRERGAFANDSMLRANELMHEYGLNVRYLGYVLMQVTIGNPAHMLLLVEMVARVIKIEARSLMRKKAADVKIVTNEPHKALIAALFDLIFAANKSSKGFWKTFIVTRLQSKFGVSKVTWGDFPDDLRTHVLGNLTARMNLYSLLCEMIGVEFEDQQGVLIKRACLQMQTIFSYESVKKIIPIVRQLDFVAEARGWLYQSRAAEHESRGFFSSAQHFYNASVDAYKAALSRSPVNSTILRQLGEVVFKVTRLESAQSQGKRNLAMVQLDPESINLRQSRSYFVRAIKVDGDPINYQAYAQFLENLGLDDHAEALYLQALTVNPNHVYNLVRYGQFLSHSRQLYEIAGMKKTSALFYSILI